MLTDLLYRIRALFRRSAVEGELDEELRFHYERLTEKFVHKGLPREGAMRWARIELGGAEQLKEECRESWGIRLIESVIQDVDYALRVLRQSPGFAVAVVLSLALGIGANTAIFSLIDAVMLRNLPVKDPGGLWVIGNGMNYRQYRAIHDQKEVADLAAYSSAPLNVSVEGGLEPTAAGQLVSGEYFSLLGVSPVAGRAIGPDDDLVTNGHPVTMISYGFWERRFGREPATVGRIIWISGMPFTIIGVTPPEFFGVEVGAAPDLFVPLVMQPAVMPAFENLIDDPRINRGWVQALARLKPGFGAERASAVLSAIYQQASPPPKFAPPQGVARQPEKIAVTHAATGISELRRRFSQPLFVLMAIVGTLLLIACANTANLLLARAAARGSEFAMRLALGAGRWRLTRQLLVESILLAGAGGLCGILLARWATRLLVLYMSSGRTPIVLDMNPNLRVLAFTASVSVITGILFGLAPALRATRVDLAPGLKNLGNALTRGRSGLRPGRILAVLQVALSLLLLMGAGLFLRSLRNLNGEESEVSRQSVIIVRVEPKGSDQRGIPGTTARLDRTYRDLLQRVEQIPGVRMASMGQVTPLNPQTSAAAAVTLPSDDALRIPTVMVYPNYFGTVGMPFVAGRDFGPADLAEDAPLGCIVNEAFARKVFPGENPLGKACTIGRRPQSSKTTSGSQPTPEAYSIIGVVRDSRYSNPTGETQPLMYLTFLQTNTGRGQMVLHARVSGNIAAAVARIRREVADVDPTLPLFDVHTLEDEMDAALVSQRLIAALSSWFGGLALLLASVGLYGLLAFGVVQRTREMGIRTALGARRGDVQWIVMREALWLVGLGIAAGVPAAFAVTRIAGSQIAGLLFGLKATDPVTIAVAALVLSAVAAIAAYVPARRASLVDPIVALRNE